MWPSSNCLLASGRTCIAPPTECILEKTATDNVVVVEIVVAVVVGAFVFAIVVEENMFYITFCCWQRVPPQVRLA